MGKAKLRKTAVDIIKQNEIDKKKAFGIARNNFTGIVQAGRHPHRVWQTAA